MAPRKRAASSSLSSSTRKSNQSNQQSQPSKFGIQHFFDRHSQAAVAPRNTNPDIPNPSPNPPTPNPNPNPNPNPSPTTNPNPSQITPSPADQPPPAAIADAVGSSLQISPEISKSAPLKRFRFSPGMLIKQSQDDGGDEVTWKISPINERLRSITAKQLLGMMRFFPDVSRPSNSSLQPCSLKQVYSCSEGRLEKWLSSPTSTLQENPLPSSRRASSLQDSEVSSDVGTMDFRSPFQTPPSGPYGPIELVGATACNGTPDHLGPLQHRKALLELLDQVEDAITEEVLPDDPMLCEDHGLVDGKINNVHDPIDKNVVAAPPKWIYGVSHDITFLVLEVSEKHKSTGSSCVRSPFKVLLGAGVAFVE